MTLEELKKQGAFVSGNQQFVYTAKTIASGHPDFESYTVILTPEQGLCKIQAVSKDIDTSSFGNELQGKYRELVGALSKNTEHLAKTTTSSEREVSGRTAILDDGSCFKREKSRCFLEPKQRETTIYLIS
ncbi:MAG: hypothetical protein IPL15_25355 [Comamonadaceae bacterium]|uniref:hypothetical protein n=1 Tax=Candidatus Skiveiella danica TaxID=3386177 RepID=UPI00390C2F1C|nr:hypothetical protein [Comamonadaceae bacterium]